MKEGNYVVLLSGSHSDNLPINYVYKLGADFDPCLFVVEKNIKGNWDTISYSGISPVNVISVRAATSAEAADYNRNQGPVITLIPNTWYITKDKQAVFRNGVDEDSTYILYGMSFAQGASIVDLGNWKFAGTTDYIPEALTFYARYWYGEHIEVTAIRSDTEYNVVLKDDKQYSVFESDVGIWRPRKMVNDHWIKLVSLDYSEIFSENVISEINLRGDIPNVGNVPQRKVRSKNKKRINYLA